MSEPPRLTDSTVRELAGAARYQRALADLSSGKVVERRLYTNGVASGKWNAAPDAPLAVVTNTATELGFDCTCLNSILEGICAHGAALALALAREPQTFMRMNYPADVDELLDEYEALHGTYDDVEEFVDALTREEEAEAMGMGYAPRPSGPASAAPPAVEHISSTLTLQLPHLRDEYRALLNHLNLNQLREVARRRGVKLGGAKREPIIETLAEALGRPPAVAEAWGALSAPARLALGLIPFLNSAMGVSPQHLQQVLQSVNSKAAHQLDGALEELKNVGLVFDRFNYLLIPPGLHYLFPPDPELVRPLSDARHLREANAPGPLEFAQFMLRLLLALKAEGAHLRLHAPEPHPLQTQMPEIKAWPFAPAELDALHRDRNLYNALYTRAFTVPPAPPLLTDESSKALRRALEASPEQIEFGLRLLAKMGLLALAPGQPPAVREEGFAQYLGHHPVEHLAPLFNAWMNLRDWSELDWLSARQPALRLRRQGLPGMTYAQLLAALSSARLYLIHHARRAPPGEWIDLDAFVARARTLNLLQAVWQMPPGVSLELNNRALNLANAEGWRSFYGPFVETVLTGPLHWMGLVDLGYRKDRLAAFRLTDLGAFMLYQRETYTAPPVTIAGRALTYAPDGALHLQPAAADARLLGLLSLMGEVRAGPNGALVYRVTVEGAARAFESGGDPDKIIALLEKAAGAPPPASLTQMLRQWWEHFGDVHLYRDLALMELADDYVLTELLASTSLSQYLLYRFSPRLVALRPEGVEALREELVGKGYTPKITDGE